MKVIKRQREKSQKAAEYFAPTVNSFQNLWENLPVACHILTPEGIITHVNQTEARMLGYKKEEMVGKSIFDFVLPEQRLVAKKRFQQKLAGRRLPRARDRIYVRKDGSKINVIINDRIKWDSQKKPICVFGTLVNITNYKKIEAESKTTEERYRDLVEKAGIAILIADQKGNFKYLNKRYAEIFGYTLKEMQNLSISSVVHPDDLKRVMSYYQGRLQGKKVPSRYEYKGVKKDGSVIYLEVDSAPIMEGKIIVGTRSYQWDITERKKAETVVRESEGLFRSIVEHSHDGILLIDENYKIIYCNGELVQNLGYAPDEILGHDFRDFLDEESRPLVADHYLRRQRGEKIAARYEFNIVRRDGTKRRVEISSDVIKDAGGEMRTVAQLLDITDRKKAEDLNQEMMKNMRNWSKTVAGFTIQRWLRPACSSSGKNTLPLKNKQTTIEVLNRLPQCLKGGLASARSISFWNKIFFQEL